MKKWCTLILFIWCTESSADWFPLLTGTHSAGQIFNVQGLRSGIGYSQDPSNCDYLGYLQRNEPLPQDFRTKALGCEIYINVSQFIGGSDNTWQGIGNAFGFSAGIRQDLLYDRKVETIGEMLRLISETSGLPDSANIDVTMAVSDPNKFCFSFTLRTHMLGQTWQTRNSDRACYKTQLIHPLCEINQAINLDHGVVDSALLPSGTVTATTNIELNCNQATSVVLKTNNIAKIKLNAINGSGSVFSELFLNGRSLAKNNGIEISANAGSNPLEIKSVLSGDATTQGSFIGIGVLIITVP